MTESFDKVLDARGLFCPEPVMLLHQGIADICEGQVLKLVATDPSTTRDVPRFCEFLGHELLAVDDVDGEYRFYLRKGGQ